MIEFYSGAVLLAPWILKIIGAILLALFAWKFGLPAARILNLEQEVKLLKLELATEKATRMTAELVNRQLQERIDEVLGENKRLSKRLSACLTVMELKSGALDGDALDRLKEISREG